MSKKLINKFLNPSGPIKNRWQQLDELYWGPESWFAHRTPKPDGTLYSEEEAAILASHVPEYKKIEKESKENGTWLQMPDGSTWEGDPRSWVMMLSEAYKKNYSSQPWYTGLGEWETNFDFPDDNQGTINTNKVTRAPYFNGQMWFSNDKNYGDAFSYYYSASGYGHRFNDEKTRNVKGKTFLTAIPKKGNYRDLEPPSKYSDNFANMPYKLKGTDIVRAKGQRVLTDTIANWSKRLGDDGIFMHKVDDGYGILYTPNPGINKVITDKNGDPIIISGEVIPDVSRIYPILEEFISQPGFTNKVKFIEGNTGDFDINDPYKYAENSVKRNDQDIYHAKQGRKLIPKHAKGSPVNNNPLPKYLINDNPIPSKKEDKKKKKLFEIDLRVVGLRPTPGLLTFPRGNGDGLYMIKRNE